MDLDKVLEDTEALRERIRVMYQHAEDNENCSPRHDALWHALKHAEDLHHWIQEVQNADQ